MGNLPGPVRPASGSHPAEAPHRILATLVEHSDAALTVVTTGAVLGALALAGPFIEEPVQILDLLVACSVFVGFAVVLARYVRHRRGPFLDWAAGDGRLAPPGAILAEVLRYAVLEGVRGLAAVVTLAAACTAFLTIPGFVMSTLVLVLLGGFVVLSGRLEAVTSDAGTSMLLAWLSLAVPSGVSFVLYRRSRTFTEYLDLKVRRFHAWDGVLHEARGGEGRLAALAERVDAWVDDRLYPPLTVVAPSYVAIVEGGAGEEGRWSFRCAVCGEDIEGPHVRCGRCDRPHHRDCWDFVGRCSTYGCGGTSAVASATRTDSSPDSPSLPDVEAEEEAGKE